jgi:hypothetical protein
MIITVKKKRETKYVRPDRMEVGFPTTCAISAYYH